MANVKTCPTCDGSGGVETIHYDESGYGNPPERTLDRCPTCNGEGEVRAGARTIDGGVWGPLTVDEDALAEKLAEATRAVYDAGIVAQYRNEAGFPVQSPLSLVLGGLSQVIDGLIDDLEERRDATTSAPPATAVTDPPQGQVHP